MKTSGDRNGYWKAGALAGICGGIAEITWVSAYSALTGTSASEVAGQITASFVRDTTALGSPALLGLAIHLALSVLLGIAFAAALWPRDPRSTDLMPIALTTLVAVWMVNFFVVLPVLNPAFVSLMPYAVTLMSKALFAITMALVLGRAAAAPRSKPGR